MGTPAGKSTVSGGRRPNPRVAQLRRTFYFLTRNTLAMVGLAVLVFFAAVAIYAFFYPAPFTQLESYCGTYPSPSTGCIQVCTYSPPAPPPQANCYPVDSLSYGFVGPTVSLAPFDTGPLPLGSLAPEPNSQYFYNIYAGEVKGAPWSLMISVSIVLAGAGIGLVLGAVAGYKGGTTDEVIMRFTDIFLSIPAILLVIVFIAALSQLAQFQNFYAHIYLLVIAFVIVWWPFYTRVVRGQVLVTREQKYVEAARASGGSSRHLIFKHIIPNSLYPVFVQIALDVGTIPLLIATLVFLGFPIFPTQWFPEWGSMAANSVSSLPGAINTCEAGGCVFPWWQIFFPGLIIFLFAISVNFLSDGLRDALDPRLRR